jgi:hypothetical protein
MRSLVSWYCKVKQSREPVVVMVGVSRNEGCGRCFEVLGVSYDSLRSACCCAPASPCDDLFRIWTLASSSGPRYSRIYFTNRHYSRHPWLPDHDGLSWHCV